MSGRIVLVAGHGDLGGGEVMLLACADALAAVGMEPVVVAPTAPAHVLSAARCAGHATVEVPALPEDPWWRTARATRRAVARVREQDAGTPVWCHGLRPVVATAGIPGRIAHVHRVPTRAQMPVLAAAAAGARAVVVPSESTRGFLPRHLARHAHVLGNWSEDTSLSSGTRGDDDGAPAAEPLDATAPRGRRAGEPPVVGYLGRIAPEKGLVDLVKAVELLDEQGVAPRPLVRVGGEALFVFEEQAEELSRAMGRLGVRLLREGWVQRRDFLSRVDVLVCPSRVPESFGLVAAEAMAAGVPVVVTDAGALPEVVGPDHPWVAGVEDPVSLACVLRQALGALGTEAGERAVARARRRWEALWSPAAGRERVAGLLRDLGILP
ncbi:glycosyltransferase [Kocuria rhizophila]|uniref:glycosyltransferase n=1 Tax=Kocuria rhizophila TaxID=72000 RepID=UPI003D700AF8